MVLKGSNENIPFIGQYFHKLIVFDLSNFIPVVEETQYKA